MKRYLLDSEGEVKQVIELEDNAIWSPPEGIILAAKEFIPPPIVDEESTSEPDYKTMYTNTNTIDEKLDVLAKALNLKD